MTEQVDWLRDSPNATATGFGRRRILLLCVLVWTLCVVAALWFLLRGNAAPSVWLVQAPPGAPPAEPLDRFHAFFKADLGLTRIYPWVLFGPYVALVTFLFPLERGRLGLALVLNLAACVAFVAGSNALEARTRVAYAKVVILGAASSLHDTNTIEIRVSKTDLTYQVQEQFGVRFQGASTDLPPGIPTGQMAASYSGGITNFLTQSAQHWPGLPPLAPSGLSFWTTLLNLLAYAAIAGLTHAVHFYRRFRERERRALFLETSVSRAKLQALRAQLQPHFLFNSLNAIVTLLRRDPRLAEATLMALSELLRLALSQSERQEVTLREELKFIERYLEIQQTRFGDKLRLEQAIDSETLDCLVPTLVLQPLVENAIRHGLEPSEDGGRLRLSAHRSDGRLVLTVEDDGVGLKAAAPRAVDLSSANPGVPNSAVTRAGNTASSDGSGIGLNNLRARLETLYGAAHKLELRPRAQRGVSVRVEIPWHAEASPEHATSLPV